MKDYRNRLDSLPQEFDLEEHEALSEDTNYVTHISDTSAINLNNPDELRKAIITNEILNRKY